MLGLVDGTRRPLTIPPRFISYLEKHKIYELFQELAKQLIIDQPEDHIAYLKQCIEHAVRKRDVPRIILITPPNFNKMGLADVLQKEIGIRSINLKDLRSMNTKDEIVCPCDTAKDLALYMRKLLTSGTFHESGWTLVDIPRTKKEACALQRFGIIPTHVIQIIQSNLPDCTYNFDTLANFDYLNYKSYTTSKRKDRMYEKNLRDLREVYADVLIEVEVGIRSIEELGKDCAALTKIKKQSGAPSLFRIALIGSRGSGRHTLSKYISEKFNLIHIDFDYILEQALLQENPLGEMLRAFEHKWGRKPKAETRIKIIESYTLKSACLRRGWILTGYPKTVEELKLLDTLTTPPNRVIFLQVDANLWKERIINRCCKGIAECKNDNTFNDKYDRTMNDDKVYIHPRDYDRVIEREIQEYDDNVMEMMEYAGQSAFVINGNDKESMVKEKLEDCMMRSMPYVKPRRPETLHSPDPYDVEFDPDDEPDINIFDTILKPERKFTFT